MFLFLHTSSPNKALQASKELWGDRCILISCDAPDWRTALSIVAKNDDKYTVLLIDGKAVSLSEGLAEELAGWVAQHPDIAWASAISLNPNGTVL